MAKGSKPFKYRGGWRAQVTLANGKRPFGDFKRSDGALQWIADEVANANTAHEPEIGGPRQARLADALRHYAGLHTISKRGYKSELNRINHYLRGAGLKLLKLQLRDNGRDLVEVSPRALPSAFAAHREQRLGLRQGTYEAVEALAKRRCSTLCTADFQRLMVTMEKEGLSPSTIQKEIALLKHMFNKAAQEWNWRGFENPCVGLKLGGSNRRFVFLTQAQQVALRAALAECDNPYFWPLVECCVQTTMRSSSLLAMARSNVDLDGRIAVVPSKTGPVSIPLTKQLVQILRDMPSHESGRYFPMSSNAVDMAWDGVRIKAGLPTLQFRDLRHVGATGYARAGMNAHQLQAILGHKSSRMAEVYVNLVQSDALAALDRLAPMKPVYQLPEPAAATGADDSSTLLCGKPLA